MTRVEDQHLTMKLLRGRRPAFISRSSTCTIRSVSPAAWIGGTLDATGSVVAAAALISESALKAGIIVEFSQNVLIGLAAFIISFWWTVRKKAEGEERPTARVIWERFPKIVLGFIVASLVFSFLLAPALVADTRGLFVGLRTTWFALAFTSIGLETRLIDLLRVGEGRPAVTFIVAQAFNVIWTLLLAFLLFGGYLFPAPALK